MELYHSSCYDSVFWKVVRWFRGTGKRMPRFIYLPGEFDKLTNNQTFRCDCCGSKLHVDIDFEDIDGGFVGTQHTNNEFMKYVTPSQSWREE